MENAELAQFFSPDLFISQLSARNKTEALRLMVEHLARTRGLDYGNVILSALLEREKLGSTGLGKEVAVPHTRSLGCKDLTVVAARLTRGLEFASVDGKPVKLIFMILAPYQEKGNRYLPLLGKIVESIRDDARRKRLIQAETFEIFLSVLQA